MGNDPVKKTHGSKKSDVPNAAKLPGPYNGKTKHDAKFTDPTDHNGEKRANATSPGSDITAEITGCKTVGKVKPSGY